MKKQKKGFDKTSQKQAGNTKKGLGLNIERLRELTPDEASRVAGGIGCCDTTRPTIPSRKV